MYYKKRSFGKRGARSSASKKAFWRGVRAGKRMAFRSKKRRW